MPDLPDLTALFDLNDPETVEWLLATAARLEAEGDLFDPSDWLLDMRTHGYPARGNDQLTDGLQPADARDRRRHAAARWRRMHPEEGPTEP